MWGKQPSALEITVRKVEQEMVYPDDGQQVSSKLLGDTLTLKILASHDY